MKAVDQLRKTQSPVELGQWKQHIAGLNHRKQVAGLHLPLAGAHYLAIRLSSAVTLLALLLIEHHLQNLLSAVLILLIQREGVLCRKSRHHVRPRLLHQVADLLHRRRSWKLIGPIHLFRSVTGQGPENLLVVVGSLLDRPHAERYLAIHSLAVLMRLTCPHAPHLWTPSVDEPAPEMTIALTGEARPQR